MRSIQSQKGVMELVLVHGQFSRVLAEREKRVLAILSGRTDIQ